ncbi:hypothetical protein DL762_008990 [Monosporascus cannonballus]|uniref:Carboxylesterase type B domain-containing protein n=1 Tax=Monosporascus cannonballus TaxID=155416 RepID=A0ABY0GUL2_9PEZI|nr:hypothetical protein DL762_008990 [Monosporascus cannonballus]
MHLRPVFVFLFTVPIGSGSAVGRSENQDTQLRVKTENDVVLGTIAPAAPGVHQFLGIPYAEPPLNELRFAPPQPKRPFPRPVQATKIPPSCIQYLTNNGSVYTREVLEFNLCGLDKTSAHISEDCLTLSVWTPAKTRMKNLLPVFTFLHGGGFRWGGQDQPYNRPTQWVQRSKSHIVVILNHSLNFFGFPNAAGLGQEKQNVGLMDQRLAVEWVRDNIERVGGDPSLLVIWGQSAGAIATGYYAFAYHGDPIVSALIMDSGTELVDKTTHDPTHFYFSWVASQVGCEKPSAEEELACMRRVDAKRTEGPAIIGSNAEDGVPFAPYNRVV